MATGKQKQEFHSQDGRGLRWAGHRQKLKQNLTLLVGVAVKSLTQLRLESYTACPTSINSRKDNRIYLT